MILEGIGKLIQKAITFILCTRDSSASITKKISIDIGPKTEQREDLIRNEQT